jgi:4-hydroxybenzoate polyprenyltransferase
MATSVMGISKLKLFFALSRTPHGLLDMATPILGALLWLDGIPPLRIISWGIVTLFAGYTAVYALNDVMDYRIDQEKVKLEGVQIPGNYLDAVLVRHPMAQGVLGFREGLIWSMAWGALALIGAFLLNPVCAFIFICGCILEAVYCKLLKVSYFRTLVSGVVKTCGCMAAVFAVDPYPSPAYLSILFLWLFSWEIGGQNIPADWTDTEVDRNIQAQTIPVRFGHRIASLVILGMLSSTILFSGMFFWISPVHFPISFVFGILLLGLYFLLYPAFRLYHTRDRKDAMVLFNKASYYPLAVLTLILIKQIAVMIT